jgi:hypothetical protein
VIGKCWRTGVSEAGMFKNTEEVPTEGSGGKARLLRVRLCVEFGVKREREKENPVGDLDGGRTSITVDRGVKRRYL